MSGTYAQWHFYRGGGRALVRAIGRLNLQLVQSALLSIQCREDDIHLMEAGSAQCWTCILVSRPSSSL